ncbi:VaFE repeat-containing surface-anchored protein [Aerococcaceae bacterium NML160702]|nr:VaFE repeat-containing surface-anchored protein [Aerococcaceae bacterium NML160702]
MKQNFRKILVSLALLFAFSTYNQSVHAQEPAEPTSAVVEESASAEVESVVAVPNEVTGSEQTQSVTDEVTTNEVNKTEASENAPPVDNETEQASEVLEEKPTVDEIKATYVASLKVDENELTVVEDTESRTFSVFRSAPSGGTLTTGSEKIGTIYYAKGDVNRYWDDIYVLKINGNVVFCIEPMTEWTLGSYYNEENFPENITLNNHATHTPGVNAGQINIDKNTSLKLEKIINFGYFANPTPFNYGFTQAYAWETLGITLLNEGFIAANRIAYDAFKVGVDKRIAEHTDRPSWNNQTLDIKVGSSVTLQDSNGILPKLNIPAEMNGLAFEKLSDTELRITALNHAQNGQIIFQQAPKNATEPVSLLFKRPGAQTFGSFQFRDPVGGRLNFNILPNLGSILLNKTTSEGNVLPGTEFELLKDNVVVATQTTNAQGQLSFIDLLEGLYSVREKNSPYGYVLNTEVKAVNVVAGQQAMVGFVNQVQKARIKIIKQDAELKTPLAGAVFEFTNAQAQGHKFSLTTNNLGEAITDVIALGIYTYRETVAPKGYVLDSTVHTIEITATDKVTPVFEAVRTVFNKDVPPTIGTSAVTNDGKEADALETVTIVDAVTFTDLIIGKEYTINGLLMDKLTNKPLLVNGKEVRSTLTFIAEQTSGTKNLSFTFNASALKGKEIVVFEDLLRNGQVIASHADINDKAQTVRITHPKLGTTATNKADGLKVIDPLKVVTIQDVVAYTDLIIGKTYRIDGILMDKGTQKALLVDGKEIRSSLTFAPKAKAGTITLDFVIDGSVLAGKTIVVFENLYRNNQLVASHTDINDEGQTVRITTPDIGTSATNKADGLKEIDALETVTVKDAVRFTDLIVGKQYTVSGNLRLKETGEILLDNGKEVTSSITFIAETPNGTIDLDFTFNATALKGKEIVAFERLYREGEVVAAHEDLNDAAQTVRITHPKLGTTATNKADGLKVIDPLKVVTIQDVVAYKDLIIGKTYRVDGVLMDRGTERPLLVNGKEVRSTLTFAPKAKAGTVTLDFIIDGSVLAGKTIVVFENLYRNNQLVASHTDINDEGQTVRVTTPGIGTTATNKEDGSKVVEPLTTVTVQDAVRYTDLIVGKTYTVTGDLRLKETGEVLMDNGKKVTSTVTFVAEKSRGTINLDFTFNASALKGKEIVAFERLYREGELIATHEDLNDAAQTVRVTNPRIQTLATFDDEAKERVSGGKVTIHDTVKFEDLKAGQAYRLKAVLMQKETEKPLVVNGKEVTGTLEFVAEATEGEVVVPLVIEDSTGLSGKFVVYEELERLEVKDPETEDLSQAKGEVIAEHKDINDEGQTITFHLPPTPQLPATGEMDTLVIVFASLSFFALGFVVVRRKEV